MKLHDSGSRQEFDTGAVRDPSEGKGRYDLISPYALRRLALHYEAGAEKYADRNWEQGIPASRCFSSAVRHLFQWATGQKDEDHLAAAAWNVFAVMHFEETKKDMVDMGIAQKDTCGWCKEPIGIGDGDTYMDGTGKYHGACFPFRSAEVRREWNGGLSSGRRSY